MHSKWTFWSDQLNGNNERDKIIFKFCACVSFRRKKNVKMKKKKLWFLLDLAHSQIQCKMKLLKVNDGIQNFYD